MISNISAVPAFTRPVAQHATQPEGVNEETKNKSGTSATAAAKTAPGGTAAAARTQAISKPEPASAQKAEAEPSKPAQASEELSEEEQRQVQKLKQADAKVRAHEQAHSSAGGSHAGGPSYEFTTGPDGKRYATSGEVQIDTTPVKGNPEATVRKMDTVIRAALAPSDPSSQDLAVARQAQATRAQAQIEASKKREAERNGNNEGSDSAENPDAAEKSPGSLESTVLQANAAYAQTQSQDNSAIAKEIFSSIAQAALFA